MKMYFSKIRDVKTPVRGDSEASGIDFFVPEFDEEFQDRFDEIEQNNDIYIKEDKEGLYIELKTNNGVLIPLGIKVNLPKDHDMSFVNKSGIASKYGLLVGARLIDRNYEGEVHLNFWNVKNETFKIRPRLKAIQGVIRKVELLDLEEQNIDDLFIDNESTRGECGFGSTGI